MVSCGIVNNVVFFAQAVFFSRLHRHDSAWDFSSRYRISNAGLVLQGTGYLELAP